MALKETYRFGTYILLVNESMNRLYGKYVILFQGKLERGSR